MGDTIDFRHTFFITIDIPVCRMLTHDDEVDFILKKHGDNTAAIEVKSGRRKGNRGLGVFEKSFHPQTSMVVGSDALPLEMFLSITPDKLF